MMMRSAKFTESAICEPPNPRLTTGKSGKSCARLVHLLMLELPTNTMQFLGGGFVVSLASKAAISFSHCAELCVASELGGTVWQPTENSATRTKQKLKTTNRHEFTRMGADSFNRRVWPALRNASVGFSLFV